MSFLAVVLHDIRFQWRHGIYGVYALVCGLYVVLLHYVPSGPYREMSALLLTFSDPGALGLIMAGGILLLERDQGVHDPLFVAPIRLRDYLVSKAVSLSVVSLSAAWVIHLAAVGMPSSPVLFSSGVALTSCFFTFLSIGIVARCRSINGFIMLSQLYALPFALPILGLFGIGHPLLYRLFPTDGSLVLLRSAYHSVASWEAVYSMALLLLGNAAVYRWAHRSFRQHVLVRLGKGGAGE